jgi:hypothetical protein
MAPGISTSFQLDGAGFELQWGWDFPDQSRPTPRSAQLPASTSSGCLS